VAEALILILKHALGIYETKQARKYLDEVIELEQRRYDETNRERVNHAVLDNIDARLRLIAEATSKFGKPNSTSV
jgi:hypothetical protein